ncbi:hypothetical protein ACLSU7_01810 [Bdellovibrio sp. HCB185ZH]|uniref:DUF7674 family protein n=1 Tax=Bdellovibrio sp. HCB185ZH TaxID=3394235 RepID=UPI0039A694E0
MKTEEYSLENVIQRLLKAYPDFYRPIAKEAEEWISNDGQILLIVLFGNLGQVIREKTLVSEPDGFESVFDLMEDFAGSGDELITAAALMGFMESVFNYGDGYDPKFLACLLGPKSREFLKHWESIHGNDSTWLDSK